MTLLGSLSRAVARADSWLSLVTGVGTTTGRASFAFREAAPLADESLEALYDGDPFAAQICDAVPEEALRKGFTLGTGDAAADAALAKDLDRLAVAAKLTDVWAFARCFGGAMLWLGVDDGLDPALPLDPARIREVLFLTVLTKSELQPETWFSDTRSPHFGEPEVYRIVRTGGTAVQNARVHASRLIRFDGARTTRKRRQRNQGWANSELQRVLDVLTQFHASFASVGTLLQDASQGVFGIKDLYGMMAQDKESDLRKRLQLMDMSRGVGRAIMIDADLESFTRVEVGALTGLSDAARLFILLLAGAARIPVTVLMGQAPAGLTATGDSDIRLFYDRTASLQQNMLRQRLARLARVLCLAKRGPTNGVDPGVTIEFASLYQLTPSEDADLRSKQATTDAIYIDKGVATPEEIATSRFPVTGWSAKTTIDLGVRRAAQDADATGAAAGDPSAPVALPAGPDPEHASGIMDVIERVGSRAIDRTAGIGLLTTTYGMSPDQAEQAMGETGRTHFTTPEPGHAAELASAKQQLAAAQRSQQSTKAMLARVLERNKNGELVLGRIITGKAPDATEGEVLEEGDAVAVPAEASAADDLAQKTDGGAPALRTVRADAFAQRALQASLRLDGELPTGVAIVLPLRPEAAQAAAVPGGEGAPDLHVTLAFFGASLGVTPDTLATIRTALAAWSATQPPIDGWLAGQGRFLAPEGEPDPVYLSPDCPTLSAARERLVAALTAAGVAPADTHGFVPHVTVAYVPKGAGSPPAPSAPIALTFGDVGLWIGPARETFALGGV